VKHGAGAYRTGRCKCVVCTKEHSARQVRENAVRAERLAADPTLAVTHGSKNTYNNWLCRCELCKAANAEASADRRARARRRKQLSTKE